MSAAGIMATYSIFPEDYFSIATVTIYYHTVKSADDALLVRASETMVRPQSLRLLFHQQQGYLVKPLEYPKLKLPRYRLRYLSLEEEKLLLAALDPMTSFKYRPKYEDRPDEENRRRQDNYDIVVLLLDTGARYGEIASITWDRIDLEQKTINLWRSKVRNESIIYIAGRVYDILKRRHERKTCDFVFTNGKGKPRGYARKFILLIVINKEKTSSSIERPAGVTIDEFVRAAYIF